MKPFQQSRCKSKYRKSTIFYAQNMKFLLIFYRTENAVLQIFKIKGIIYI